MFLSVHDDWQIYPQSVESVQNGPERNKYLVIGTQIDISTTLTVAGEGRLKLVSILIQGLVRNHCGYLDFSKLVAILVYRDKNLKKAKR